MLIDHLSIPVGHPSSSWPFTVPSVAQIARDGLRLTSSVVVLSGPNGSGKSTLLEAVAEAYGLDVRGGHGDRRYASSAPRGILGEHLVLGYRTGRPKRRTGFFLRAETAFGMLAHMTEAVVAGYGDSLSSERSHGESYLDAITGRFTGSGLLLDEAEGPLSFESTLTLMLRLSELSRRPRTQVIYATHSPLIAALPGAQVLTLGDDGIREVPWEELDSVGLWRSFLADPSRFLEGS